MRRREMDIGQSGVDVIVPHQRLHDRQINAGLGQCGAEGVTQRVRVAGRHPGPRAVVAKHRKTRGGDFLELRRELEKLLL